jgi:uncharacterized protein with HEPN domain
VKDDRVYLEHILGSAEKIGRFIASGRDAFFADDMAQDAVVRNLTVIGEATKQLSEETREAHPDVPWRAIARMRDRLIHAYFGVDWNLVWLTVTEEVPQLAARVAQILETDKRR